MAEETKPKKSEKPAPKPARSARIISVSDADAMTLKERYEFTHSHPGNTIVEDAALEAAE